MRLRYLLIYASLIIIFLSLIGFMTGPIWGLRLDYEKGQQLQVIQIIIPTFLSYLAAAVVYVTKGASFVEPRGERGRILTIITIGVLAIFASGMITSIALYYFYANGTLRTSYFTFERLCQVMSILLGIMAATTTAVSTYLFTAKQ
jgi:hypothetical protein